MTNWIACAERTPESSEDVLVAWAGEDGVDIGNYSLGGWTNISFESLDPAPTHWMSLPEPPRP